jgi:hypothetical protein
MGMIGAAAAATIMDGHVGDRSKAAAAVQVVGVKPNNGRFLTVEYMEFDLQNDEELFEELRKVNLSNAKELVRYLKGGTKILKQLQAVVPLSPGGTGEGTDAAGESMLRVKLTSITAQDNKYAIKANFERWDWKNGMLELSSGIRQQEVKLQPGTSEIATLQAPYRADVKTKKTLTRKIVIWMVQLSKAGKSEELL